jgi:hypothetical protein
MKGFLAGVFSYYKHEFSKNTLKEATVRIPHWKTIKKWLS